MTKNYFYIILLLCFFSVTNVVAQESKTASRVQDPIEGLSFYPNPVNTGKIYITSKTNEEKLVTIFDVLGKKVLQTTITNKELNISILSPGVYIIKFEEGNASTTRKLIIR
jgi:hypothetical protein